MLLLLVVTCAFSAAALLPSYGADGESSAGPVSEFEKFFHTRSLTPAYPFTALLEQLTPGDSRLDPEAKVFAPGVRGFYAQVPDGRSLQKRKANFKDPRELIAYQSFSSTPGLSEALRGQTNKEPDLHFISPPPLFIGHAELGGQLEVISWNPTLRQYDFLTVENYAAGKTPVIKRIDRSICLACHQAGGPIFARGNWSESSQFNADIGIRMVNANRGDQKILREPDGFPPLPSHFDTAVRSANSFLQATNICSTVCNEDTDCRRSLLKAAMLRQSLKGQTFGQAWEGADAFKRELQSMLESRWPADGYAYPSSVLPDRIPGEGKRPAQGLHLVMTDEEAFTKQVRKDAGHSYVFHSFEDERKRNVPVEYNESISSEFVVAPGLDGGKNVKTVADRDPTLDPTTPRPKVSGIRASDASAYLVDFGSRCLGLFPADLKALSRFSPAHIDQMLSGARADTLVQQSWPPSRERIMAVATAALDGLPEPDLPCEARVEPPLDAIAAASMQATLAVTRAMPTAMGHFQQFCASCHAGESAIVNLGVRSLEDLKRYRGKDGASALERIRTGAMPLGHAHWTGERKRAWEAAKPLMLQELSRP